MEYLQAVLDYLGGWFGKFADWWMILKGWWQSFEDWMNSFFSDLTTIFDSWGIADYVSDFVLDWGDWIVGWAKVVVMGALSYLSGVLLWRIMTYFLGVAVMNQAKFFMSTGIATYLIVWFWHATAKAWGVGILTFSVLGTDFVSKIEGVMISGFNKIPPVFMPMLNYFDIPDAIHFIFSVFMVIATLKVATWVFKPPLNL